MKTKIISTDKLKEENGQDIKTPALSLLNRKIKEIIQEEERFKEKFKEDSK